MPEFSVSAVRVLALSASLALGATSAVRADEVQNASPAAPAPADGGGSATVSRVAIARAVADSAKGKVAEISARLDADRQQAGVIRERMFNGESGLREMKAKAENAAGRLDARRRELAVAGARFAPLRDAYEQARVDAIRDFNASPEYRSAVEAVNLAAASLRQLSGPDADMQSARARLAEAKAALDQLRRRFMEEQLPQIPNVAAAEQPLKIEQAQCDALADAVAAAEQQVADSDAALKQQNDGLTRDRVALDELAADMSRCEAELPGAQADADKASDDLNRAASASASSGGAYAVAPPVTRQPAVEYRSSTYTSYPPAVVYSQPGIYAQPGVVYVRPQYYGNYVIQSRPLVYGYGTVRVFGGRVHAGHDYHHVIRR